MCVLVVVAQVRGKNAASLMTPKSCAVEKVIEGEGRDTGRESTGSTTERACCRCHVGRTGGMGMLPWP